MAGPEASEVPETPSSAGLEHPLTSEERQVAAFLETDQGRALLEALQKAYPDTKSGNLNPAFVLGCKEVFGDMPTDKIRALTVHHFDNMTQAYGEVMRPVVAPTPQETPVVHLTEVGRRYQEFFRTPVGVIFRDLYYRELHDPNPAAAYAEGQAFLAAYRDNPDQVNPAQIQEWRKLGVAAQQDLTKPEMWGQIFEAYDFMQKPAYYLYCLQALYEIEIRDTLPFPDVLKIRAFAAQDAAYREETDDLDDARQYDVWRRAVGAYKSRAAATVAAVKP